MTTLNYVKTIGIKLLCHMMKMLESNREKIQAENDNQIESIWVYAITIHNQNYSLPEEVNREVYKKKERFAYSAY